MITRQQQGKRWHTIVFVSGLAVLLLTAGTAQAKWWIFGKADDTPEITSLKFNEVNAENVEERLTLGPDDLVSGGVTIRGRAEVGEGEIGKVEISFDNGEKWQKVELGDRGMFSFDFRPEMNEELEFRIKALSTTGKVSDIEEHSFLFMLGPQRSSEEVRTVFRELLQRYMSEDRPGFMRLVHEDFEGDRAALEDAVSDDFLFFDNIRIEPTITRVVSFDGNYELYFTFNRRLQSARTGEIFTDSAASSMTFARGSGFLLYEMAAPLIFGLSDVGNLATNVTEESIGQEVIRVDRDGNVGKSEQGDEADETGSFDSESTTLQDFEGIFLATGVIVDDFSADINFEHNIFFVSNGASWTNMPAGSFETATQAPAGPYEPFNGPSAATGTTFAVKLADGTYAIVTVDQLNEPDFVIIRYRYPVPGP